MTKETKDHKTEIKVRQEVGTQHGGEAVGVKLVLPGDVVLKIPAPDSVISVAPWLLIIFGLLSAGLALTLWLSGDREIASNYLAPIAGVFLFVSFLIISFTRDGRSATGGSSGSWRFPQWRRPALFGLLLLAVGAFAAYGRHLIPIPPDGTTILVARFDGPDPQRYQVTDDVISRLRDLEQEVGEAIQEGSIRADPVKIVPLKRTITTEDGQALAVREGAKRKASMVIWGRYQPIELAESRSLLIKSKIRVELLRDFRSLYLDAATPLIAEVERLEFDYTFAEDANDPLQRRLAFLSQFTLGLALYTSQPQRLQGAIWFLARALDELETNSRGPDQATGCSAGSDDCRAYAHFFRGVAYYRDGQLTQAENDFGRAIEAKDDFSAAHINLGVVAAINGKLKEAEASFLKAIEPPNPESVLGHYNLGVLFHATDHAKAIEHWEKAASSIESPVIAARAHFNLGVVFAEEQRFMEAIDAFNRAKELDSRLTEAQERIANTWWSRAITRSQRGETEAVLDFAEAIKLLPDNASLLNDFCWYGGLLEVSAEVSRACEEAVRMDPDNGDFHDSYGVVLALQERRDDAIREFQKYIQLSDNQAPDEALQLRRAWIKDLEEGRTPFDAETRAHLLRPQEE